MSHGPKGVGKKPVVAPPPPPPAPAESKYATAEELTKRAEKGDARVVSFPLSKEDDAWLMATPAELAAREAKKAAEAAAAEKAKPAVAAKTPKAHKGYQKVEAHLTGSGRLIAADVPQKPGLFRPASPRGYAAAPVIKLGQEYIFIKTDGSGKVRVKADLFDNYASMDPATRNTHVPEGKVLVHVQGMYLLLDKKNREDINLLTETMGGEIVVSK